MSEPLRPMQKVVDEESASASSEGSARDASEMIGPLAAEGPIESGPAADRGRGLLACAETVSTLADQPAPASVRNCRAQAIGDMGGAEPADSTDSATSPAPAAGRP